MLLICFELVSMTRNFFINHFSLKIGAFIVVCSLQCILYVYVLQYGHF